jgi:enoyl-CoA hydratase/carnithine racemase
MQQAYSAIRVISEAQTVRIVLSTHPGELMLRELGAAASFSGPGSDGIKAVVLDFALPGQDDAQSNSQPVLASAERAFHALRAVAQPVLAVVRGSLSPAASALLAAADFTLVGSDATLIVAGENPGEADKKDVAGVSREEVETLIGAQAARLGYVTWAVPAGDLNREMERILTLLREKSAVALRLAKAAARLSQEEQAKHTPPLEALQRINTFYLSEVMRTQDANEGLHAFLEKRKPLWKNR